MRQKNIFYLPSFIERLVGTVVERPEIDVSRTDILLLQFSYSFVGFLSSLEDDGSQTIFPSVISFSKYHTVGYELKVLEEFLDFLSLYSPCKSMNPHSNHVCISDY